MGRLLIGEVYTIDTEHFDVVLQKGVTTVDVYLKDRIDKAKSFYKKYRVSTENIKKNYQIHSVYNIRLWNDYPKLVEEYLRQDEKVYNEWLFDYCFGE